MPRPVVGGAFDTRLGAKVRARRQSLGLSQKALGEALGVSFQQIQKYERGDNRISVAAVVAIAKALETSVGYLVGETDQPAAPKSAAKGPDKTRRNGALAA